MTFIHYLLFLPIAIICGTYVRFKLDQIYSVKKRISDVLYYTIIILIFTISFTNLSFFSVFLLYMSLFYFLFDIVFIIIKKLKLNYLFEIFKKIYLKGITVFIMALLITIYGLYNADTPIISKYNFKINKSLKKDYKIALISDLHYGTGTNQKDLDFIVKNINHQNVDLFIIAGDTFDEVTKKEKKEEVYKSFKNVKTNYGSYIIEGNHDIIDNNTKANLENNNITVLTDDITIINNDFYLIGRNDVINNRKSLEELTKNIDNNKGIILLDHRPVDIKKNSNFVDLQLSGHTHNGQIWPGGLLVKSGIHKINNYTLYISDGFGTWGAPVKTSGKSELVIITLSGNKITNNISKN